jgi:hypothetical protein
MEREHKQTSVDKKAREDKDSEQKCTGRREAVGLKKEEKEEEEEEEEEELGRWTGDESERLRRLAGGAELCCARLGADQQATLKSAGVAGTGCCHCAAYHAHAEPGTSRSAF